MNFKDIQIYSHPRSGSNYYADLINKNFTHKDNFRQIYGDHRFPGNIVRDNPSTAFLYIKRDFPAVLNSIFNMKERFGLLVSSPEELQQSIYKEVYNPRLKSFIQVKNDEGFKVETKISKFFSSIEMKPLEFHNLHITQWEKNKKYKNYHSVNYNDLLNNFDKTMSEINMFLGADNSEFTNTSEQVGYIPPKNGKHYLIMNIYNKYFLKPALYVYKNVKRNR
ncbi:sulfotransferase domain-containing protein [Gramella sp. Hel_I_59]|uniref:sulfotransferase domain-containing protein n=1 Tax=Gramella sp. Hel_I_59 TaxID=1249978 RepID=UPI001154F6A6|nr:sulfotransferase domain-containing protein [Gramella sp. Hel_I_59]TQI71948.1 sulfotransferase domain-containing protein [Gramella sp. Hel_I_59]